MFDTIIKGFFTGLVEDMKTIPHAAISVVLLWLTLWGLYFFVWPDLSNAQSQVKATVERQAKFEETIGSLSKNLLVLNSRLLKEDMERQLAAIEREKDDIERDIARMNREFLAATCVLEDLTPRRIQTRAAFGNAIAVAMAMGCSTNAIIHLIAMARRAGQDDTDGEQGEHRRDDGEDGRPQRAAN